MHRFSIWLQGSGAQIHWWWCTGVAAPRHVRSSQTGGPTRASCIGRRALDRKPPGKPLSVLNFNVLSIVHIMDKFKKHPHNWAVCSKFCFNFYCETISEF